MRESELAGVVQTSNTSVIGQSVSLTMIAVMTTTALNICGLTTIRFLRVKAAGRMIFALVAEPIPCSTKEPFSGSVLKSSLQPIKTRLHLGTWNQ